MDDTAPDSRYLDIAVGVVVDRDGRLLVTRRRPGTPGGPTGPIGALEVDEPSPLLP